jgi:hypothetical protein
LPFVLPEAGDDRLEWEVLLDTARPDPEAGAGETGGVFDAGDEYPLSGRSLVLLRSAS